jgi:hypothetical protein
VARVATDTIRGAKISLLTFRQDWRGSEDQALQPVRQQAQLCVRAGRVEPVDDVLDKRFARHLTQDGGIRDAPQCEECRTIQKLMRNRHIETTVLCCDVSDDTLWNAEELV